MRVLLQDQQQEEEEAYRVEPGPTETLEVRSIFLVVGHSDSDVPHPDLIILISGAFPCVSCRRVSSRVALRSARSCVARLAPKCALFVHQNLLVHGMFVKFCYAVCVRVRAGAKPAR